MADKNSNFNNGFGRAQNKLKSASSKTRAENVADANKKNWMSIFKRNPNLSIYVIYAAALILMAAVMYKYYPDKKNGRIKWATEFNNRADKMLNPMADDFIAQCVAMENIICVPIIYMETYRAVPRIQSGENVWTHGYGMTFSRDASGRMTIRDYADTDANKKNGYTPHSPVRRRSKDADLDESQQFLKDHIYPKIQKNMTRELSESELIAICAAGYQTEGHIAKICQQLSAAKTKQEIADAFITPTMFRYGGTAKRRWVCGMLAAGFITLADILDADVDNFYLADKNTFIRDGHFVCDENTIAYVLGLPRWKSMRSELALTADGRDAVLQINKRHIIGRINKNMDGKKQIGPVKSDNTSVSMGLMLQARNEFNNGNFTAAAELFERAIANDADNMDAYNNLAITYKKLGDKHNSISYYEKSWMTVKKCNARMNANRALLFDYDVKATTYYNAGLARAAAAEICATRGGGTDARDHRRIAIKNFENAIYNRERGDADAEKIEMYHIAIRHVTNGGSVKQLMFDSGAHNIPNFVYTPESGVYSIIQSTSRDVK